ncbi:substrate-binding domain-containing protein [Streptomyces sp. NPDC020875]|uniref:substrate-binding domain-containing protein n=1 Tax=Streptomyces sp. NPDC020875 TaxID=3154898 RepID=UPI0034076B70
MRSHRTAAALLAASALLVTAGCSGSGGKDADEKADGGGTTAGTPRMKIAMVTHSGEGDTFWDIVQTGAKAAAKKGNAEFLYAANKEGKEQAQLVQTYIDQKVDGIVVTLAKPEAVRDVVRKAVAAGIPVITINSGGEFSRAFGALAHIGQDESVAGEAVGAELTARGKKKAVCVIHEQGNVSQEARCAGLRKTFTGSVENLQVEGVNMPATTSTVQAKLQATPGIDAVVTLGAPFAAAFVQAKRAAKSSAEIDTFDLNAEVIKQLKAGEIGFAVDQQPYLQGYLAVDQLWLHRVNRNVTGGGKPVLTGPALVRQNDADALAELTAAGTR